MTIEQLSGFLNPTPRDQKPETGPHNHGAPPVCPACRAGDHETYLDAPQAELCTCPCHQRPR